MKRNFMSKPRKKILLSSGFITSQEKYSVLGVTFSKGTDKMEYARETTSRIQ